MEWRSRVYFVKPSARTLGTASCAYVGVELRQSYARVKRANRSLRRLKTYLGRVIRDIGRRIDGDPELEEIFARKIRRFAIYPADSVA